MNEWWYSDVVQQGVEMEENGVRKGIWCDVELKSKEALKELVWSYTCCRKVS